MHDANGYPRQPGSNVKVDSKDWKRDVPFGHCPACGSLAMEDIFIRGTPDINFYCSDVTCKDLRSRRTMWGKTKTPELLQVEEAGGSWNQWKWPGQDLPDICPD